MKNLEQVAKPKTLMIQYVAKQQFARCPTKDCRQWTQVKKMKIFLKKGVTIVHTHCWKCKQRGVRKLTTDQITTFTEE